MNATLTISSQGQVVIPAAIRRILGVKPGDSLQLRVDTNKTIPTAIIEPTTKSWVKRISGIAKGIYGDPNTFVEKERNNWDST